MEASGRTTLDHTTLGRTMLAKIWHQHVIARIGDDTDLHVGSDVKEKA